MNRSIPFSNSYIQLLPYWDTSQIRLLIGKKNNYSLYPSTIINRRYNSNSSSVDRHGPMSKTNGNNQTSNWGWKRIAAYSGILGLATFCYRQFRYQDKNNNITQITEIPQPEEEFCHPFNQKSFIFQAFITAKRFFFLSFLFLPCAVFGVIAKVLKDEEWENYWLKMLVSAFDRAGCGFQKFGQWMSMRPDMFSPELIEAMSKLQQTVSPHSYAHTKSIVLESFGHEIEEIFESFDEIPIASGTIAQVHRATLRPEFAINALSKEVAVKVRHPSVLEETYIDVDLIFKVMNLSSVFSVPFHRDHFVMSLQKQINLEWEAYSLSRFSSNFHNEIAKGELNFPITVPDLFSQSVLVESWVNGGSVKDFFLNVGDGFKERIILKTKESKETQHQRKQIAETIFGMCMKMFLRDNYMHGDLHSGNVFYHEPTECLTVLDAGHTSALTEENAKHFGSFLHGMCTANAEELSTSILKLNVSKSDKLNVEGIKSDVRKAVKKWIGEDGMGHDGRPVCVGDLTGEILFSLERNGVALPGDVATSLVSIGISEGLIRQLDPSFNMNAKALPYIAKYGVPGSF